MIGVSDSTGATWRVTAWRWPDTEQWALLVHGPYDGEQPWLLRWDPEKHRLMLADTETKNLSEAAMEAIRGGDDGAGGGGVSATGRGAERRADDLHETPAWCVHRLLEALRLPGGIWLEPCVGNGAIVRAVDGVRRDVTWRAGDIRPGPDAPVGVLQADALNSHADWYTVHRRPDVLITNPPYGISTELAERWVRTPWAHTVALLLRLNWLASSRRAAFLREFPPSVYVLPNRPSFTGGGTDATDYGWLVWHPLCHAATPTVQVLATTPAAERRGAAA